jgi:hypothetical protein
MALDPAATSAVRGEGVGNGAANPARARSAERSRSCPGAGEAQAGARTAPEHGRGRPPASRRAHPRPQAVVRACGTDPGAAPSGSCGPRGGARRGCQTGPPAAALGAARQGELGAASYGSRAWARTAPGRPDEPASSRRSAWLPPSTGAARIGAETGAGGPAGPFPLARRLPPGAPARPRVRRLEPAKTRRRTAPAAGGSPPGGRRCSGGPHARRARIGVRSRPWRRLGALALVPGRRLENALVAATATGAVRVGNPSRPNIK